MKKHHKLGTRCEAQQRVLLSPEVFRSWRDMDARIKEVEAEVIRERALPTPSERGSNK